MRAFAYVGVLYISFAVLAAVANLAGQVVVIWLYRGPYAVDISILVGTAVGLPVKYVLDKRHIFAFAAHNISQDGKLFVLYSFTGVFTTALFWGVEYAFQWLFGTDSMRYFGGAVGLALGYVIKYRLDRRFVFVAATEDVV